MIEFTHGKSGGSKTYKSVKEALKETKTKKRRGPPKGGSFGPTVGGF